MLGSISTGKFETRLLGFVSSQAMDCLKNTNGSELQPSIKALILAKSLYLPRFVGCTWSYSRLVLTVVPTASFKERTISIVAWMRVVSPIPIGYNIWTLSSQLVTLFREVYVGVALIMEVPDWVWVFVVSPYFLLILSASCLQLRHEIPAPVPTPMPNAFCHTSLPW